jgi:cytoskeletal protein CcmA (bactofilin family)
LFGAGITVHGEISGTSDLYIEGNTQGKIRLPGSKITVGPRGKVQSDIEAREIIIEGAVQGNLKADESVLLGASSRVQGGVLSPRITIADGASFRGKVEMTRGAKTAPQSESETSKENVTRVPLASRAKEA